MTKSILLIVALLCAAALGPADAQTVNQGGTTNLGNQAKPHRHTSGSIGQPGEIALLPRQSKRARLQRRFPLLRQHLHRHESGSFSRHRRVQLEMLQQFQGMPQH
jgi:hypothetical protein